MRRSSLKYQDSPQQEKSFKYRNVIAGMIFTAACVSSGLKASISIISLPMIEHKQTEELLQCSITKTWQENLNMKSLDITKSQYVTFVASFYIGNVLSFIFSDHLNELFGPVWTIGYCIVVSCLMIGVVPYIIHLNFYAGIFNVFVSGLCNAPVIPACSKLMHNWAPVRDEMRFKNALIGMYFGNIQTWPIFGFIIAYKNWEVPFFIVGITTFIWSMIWLILVSDTPDTSIFTSKRELHYIKQSQIGSVASHTLKVPYKKIFKSRPVWAYLFFEMGGAWLDSGYVAMFPLYINDTTPFKIWEIGLYLSLPPILKIISYYIFHHIYKRMMKQGSKRINVFKTFTIISHILAGLILLIIGFIKCRPVIITFLMSLVYVFNGPSLLISRNYPRIISPIFNPAIYNYGVFLPACFICLPLLLIIGQARAMNIEYIWTILVCLGSVFMLLGGTVFILRASDEHQEWDMIEEAETRESRKTTQEDAVF